MDTQDENYMSNLNAFKFFKEAGQMFVNSNSDDDEIVLIGTETTPRGTVKDYSYILDTELIKECGFGQYDGSIIDFAWED